MRATHELQGVLLGYWVEGDPGDDEVRTGDGEIGRILMPRGAPGLATLLQEDLLIEEPYRACVPQLRDQLWDRRGLEHGPVALEAGRIEQVIEEGRVRRL